MRVGLAARALCALGRPCRDGYRRAAFARADALAARALRALAGLSRVRPRAAAAYGLRSAAAASLRARNALAFGAGVALTLLSGAALAAEPVEVVVEGVAAIDERKPAEARAGALRAALVEAVVEVARRVLPGGPPPDVDRLREVVGTRAEEAVIAYKVLPEGGPRRSTLDPSLREWALRIAATVDAARIRERLRASGVLLGPAARPSLVLLARGEGEPATAPATLAALEDQLKRRLAQAKFVVVEPALRAGAAPGPLETARALGAELSLDVRARWQPRDPEARVPGGVLEVEILALRVRDGLEVALARFEAAAWHADLVEAQTRAAEALAPQAAENLILQLDRNWRALAADAPAVSVVLSGIPSLGAVEAVAAALRAQVGAGQVELRALRPHLAELLVEGPLSAGALQERLAALRFEGFRLEPGELTREQVELRVIPASGPDPGGAGKIDTQNPD